MRSKWLIKVSAPKIFMLFIEESKNNAQQLCDELNAKFPKNIYSIEEVNEVEIQNYKASLLVGGY